jgi:hypothetical protein
VKGTAECTCEREESHKYDLIATPCFWSANHNDWSKWFAIISLPLICSPSFSFMGGVAKTFFNLAQLQYPKSATTIPKTFRKVTADNFPQWVFSGAKVAELRHTQSGPDPARHPVLDVGYPGSPFRARMS